MGTFTWTRLATILLSIVSLASAEPPTTQPVAAKPAREAFVRITVIEQTDGIVRVGVPIDLLPDDFDKSTVTPVVVPTTQSAEEAMRDIEPKSLPYEIRTSNQLVFLNPGMKPGDIVLRRRFPATIAWTQSDILTVSMNRAQGEKIYAISTEMASLPSDPAPPKVAGKMQFNRNDKADGLVHIEIPRKFLATLKDSDIDSLKIAKATTTAVPLQPASRSSLPTTIVVALAITAAVTLAGMRMAGNKRGQIIAIIAILILALGAAGIAMANGAPPRIWDWFENRSPEPVTLQIIPSGEDIQITLSRAQTSDHAGTIYF